MHFLTPVFHSIYRGDFLLKILKKITIICIIAAILPICGCKKKISAREIMEKFVKEYPLFGQVYYSDSPEFDAGYISAELFLDAFIWEGELPEEFALMLNSSVDEPCECGVFYASDASERERISESCLERIKLLSDGAYKLLYCRGFIFYAVLPDLDLAEEVFYAIVK